MYICTRFLIRQDTTASTITKDFFNDYFNLPWIYLTVTYFISTYWPKFDWQSQCLTGDLCLNIYIHQNFCGCPTPKNLTLRYILAPVSTVV